MKMYKRVIVNFFDGIQKDLYRSNSFKENAKDRLKSICSSMIHEMAKERAIQGVTPSYLTVHTLGYVLPLLFKHESSEMSLYDYVVFITSTTMDTVLKWQTCDPSRIDEGISKFGPIFKLLAPVEKEALMSKSKNWFWEMARTNAYEKLKTEVNPALLA